MQFIKVKLKLEVVFFQFINFFDVFVSTILPFSFFIFQAYHYPNHWNLDRFNYDFSYFYLRLKDVILQFNYFHENIIPNLLFNLILIIIDIIYFYRH